MASLRVSLFAICAAAATVLAATPSTYTGSGPIVTLDRGTFVGTTAGGINKFLGIPFAKPPIGDLRFRLPQAFGSYVGKHNATAFGLSCPQQADPLALPDGLPPPTLQFLQSLGTKATIPIGEDCLTLNVIAPAYVKPGSKLPVVVWIYGGGFEDGSSAFFDGTVIVNRSIALHQPVVYVSMNYRLGAFGFLASKEVKDAKVGNLGLWDQRLALRWVQKYIYAFGGDSSKVTIWGESAGAISVSLQMLANGGNTEGLFRAAFMQSGSPTPVGDITNGQKYYDFLVARTNCTGSPDTLVCLRAAPYEALQAAMDSTPSLFSFQSLALAWQPRADGVFLTDHPQKLVQQGKVAKIPFVAGECDDEGTLFSLSNANITKDADLRAYLAQFFLINVTAAQVDQVLTLYPQDATLGSPFDTGTNNTLTPEFKRIASLLGDFVFQAPRRFFLKNLSGKQNTWSYLSKRLKSLPILGSAHASDIANIYGGQDLTDYLIHFVTNLDPNGRSGPHWPQYTTSSPQLLTLLDGAVPADITLDTYRADGMNFLTELSLVHPL
ncbi:carotenoid ester lipase precursor [Lactarius akahatsu]|uniref:Carboxylic ester hydrolase n=1 Tax=Lactarius akahatsu TaxID=416441 RepID=A0AAD4Q4L7_9AGAM|nr:carotenoid ester lipase precursor [Lactarius akahatsu]